MCYVIKKCKKFNWNMIKWYRLSFDTFFFYILFSNNVSHPDFISRFRTQCVLYAERLPRDELLLMSHQTKKLFHLILQRIKFIIKLKSKKSVCITFSLDIDFDVEKCTYFTRIYFFFCSAQHFVPHFSSHLHFVCVQFNQCWKQN